MPRFDLPDLARPVAGVLPERAISIPPQEPLPELIEPEIGFVDQPDDDPLVAITHREIRTLSNYWHAGWQNAAPETLIRTEVMRRLTLVADSLPPRWGLAVFDAWRPLALQQELYSVASADPEIPPDLFASPSTDPKTPPPHLTGGAVDLTLTIDGVALSLGCGFDDITPAARVDHLESHPGSGREARRFLYRSMHDAGFVVFAGEWWHFEYGTIRWSAITGRRALYGPASPPMDQLPSAL